MPFDIKNKEYKIDPLRKSIKYTSFYLKRVMPDYEDKKDTINKYIKESIDNPLVVHYQKQKNLDSQLTKTDLFGYIESFSGNDEVVAPTFTTFTKKVDSPHGGFININLKKRSIEKKASLEAEMAGNTDLFIEKDIFQKAYKGNNNSLSGAGASKGTLFTNRIYHNTLTSLTRTFASVGNAYSESMISGNRIYLTPDKTLEHLIIMVHDMDRKKVRATMKRHSIHVPSVKETFDVVRRSYKLYWRGKPEKGILEFITSCTPLERSYIVYNNDLYHLRKFNNEFVKEFIKGATDKKIIPDIEYLSILRKEKEWLLNSVHLTCMDEIKGLNINYKKGIYSKTEEIDGKKVTIEKNLIGSELLKLLGSIAYNARRQFDFFTDVIQSFFLTDTMPADIVNIKKMTRRCIVLSDTDSTCATAEEWGRWMYPERDNGFDFDKTAVAGIVMTIVAEGIGYYLNKTTKIMNMDEHKGKLIAMKNEFFWSSFSLTSRTKHYYANTLYREGSVYPKAKPERKGVWLISSAFPEYITNFSNGLMDKVGETIMNGQRIMVEDYMKDIIHMEKEVINAVNTGKSMLFSTTTIKEENSYKIKGPKGPFFPALLWKDVFEPKYVCGVEAPYGAFKVQLNLDTGKKFDTFIDEMEDRELAKRFKDFMVKSGKKGGLGVMSIPAIAVEQYGLPKELIPYIDYYKLLGGIMSPGYSVLESLGVNMFKNLLISDVYDEEVL